MGICYKCTYECDLVSSGGELAGTIEYSILQGEPCGKSFTPPTATGGTGCRLKRSEQMECTTTGDKAGHTIVGAIGGVVVCFLLVSNPGGWVVAGFGAAGAIIGWLTS